MIMPLPCLKHFNDWIIILIWCPDLHLLSWHNYQSRKCPGWDSNGMITLYLIYSIVCFQPRGSSFFPHPYMLSSHTELKVFHICYTHCSHVVFLLHGSSLPSLPGWLLASRSQVRASFTEESSLTPRVMSGTFCVPRTSCILALASLFLLPVNFCGFPPSL